MIRSPGSVPLALLDRHRDKSMAFYGDRACVWFDFRGSGHSERTPPRSLEELSFDLEAVTSAIGEPLDAISGGGSAAFSASTYAATNPGLWRSLLLIDAAVRPEDNAWAANLRPGWEDDYLSTIRVFARSMAPISPADLEEFVKAWADGVPIASMRAYLQTNAAFEAGNVLSRITIPVLVTNTFRDLADPEVAALLPNAVLVQNHISTRFDPVHIRQLWDLHIGSLFEPAPARFTSYPQLTSRESEVLALIAGGCSNAQIAEALTLSPRTVDRHIANVYGKLGIHNRVEAANWAREHGVV
jgi:DNA-binding CsgD family transcriptional regulator/pimeloyl-ACP methyl ester carboxylesterase